jgi:hypothetical protein
VQVERQDAPEQQPYTDNMSSVHEQICNPGLLQPNCAWPRGKPIEQLHDCGHLLRMRWG